MDNKANTIWIKAYTPAGTQVGITVGFEAGQLIPATELDAMIAGAGYLVSLPGVEPGEVVETITHVMRRTRHADDGRVIPIIAFYIDNPKFKGKYDHIYMDTDEEIADFEAWSGLKLNDIPEYDGMQFIDRENNPTANKYIKALPEPQKVAAGKGTWRNPRTGETGETMKIKRLLGISTATGNSTPGMVTKQWSDDVKALVSPLYIDTSGNPNPFHMKGSLNKAVEDGIIDTKMRPFIAALHVLAHRAKADYGMEIDALQTALGGKVGEVVRETPDSFANAWSIIRSSAMKEAM